ncbi:hypothetical protein BB561_002523 [Smittium simulii]|uniref:Uncharacterized protein n=1 Tax=Smittium simulii TaxID=133385 RepID=A0A2T9YQ62_9FUNG|nr:hypothetical protein BB561_002523 [Smittium simulii]
MTLFREYKKLPKFMTFGESSDSSAEPHSTFKSFMLTERLSKPGVVVNAFSFKAEPKLENAFANANQFTRVPETAQKNELITLEELYYYDKLDLICAKQLQPPTSKPANPLQYNKGIEKTMNFHGLYRI